LILTGLKVTTLGFARTPSPLVCHFNSQ